MVTIIQTDRQLEIVNAGLKPNTPTKKLQGEMLTLPNKLAHKRVHSNLGSFKDLSDNASTMAGSSYYSNKAHKRGGSIFSLRKKNQMPHLKQA